MEELNKELKTNNEKTEKEKENWISQEAVFEKLEELKKIIPTLGRKITENQFNELVIIESSPRRRARCSGAWRARSPAPR